MSGNSAAALFEPIEVGALRLPHRIVLAPMARYRCSESGVPLDIVTSRNGSSKSGDATAAVANA